MSRCVAVIPARGGSVRVPKKNIRLFHGKPIIAYSIETAKASGLFDEVIVYTDDAEIAQVGERYGASIMRRPLDDGSKGTQAVTAEALRRLPAMPRWACCIYATAPLLEPSALEYAHALLTSRRGYFEFAMGVGAEPLRDVGQFYFGRAAAFGVVPLILASTAMVNIKEDRCIDINTIADFARAEQMYSALHKGE